MRAAVYRGAGGTETLALVDLPAPACGSDEVLVDVAYAGLNRADILERLGVYSKDARAHEVVPGLEFSGTVREVGAKVTHLRRGMRVCGLVPAGAHAEIVAAQALSVAVVPEEIELVQAAAIPEAFLTAHDALFSLGQLALGQNVLVHAVGSSVGLAAVSLAARAGAYVVGTSRTADKLERARDFGLAASTLLDDGWSDRVLAMTGGRGVDVVLDFAGELTLHGNVAALATRGRIVSIGTLGGARASLSLGALMGKRGSLIGTVLKTRPLDEKIALARLLETRLLPLFARGELRVEIDSVFPLDQLAEAHDYMEANKNFGKIVLSLAEA